MERGEDGGQARRPAVRNGEELHQELAGEEGTAERHEGAPRERPRPPDRRRCRDQKPQRGELGRRDAVEADARDDERESPDDGDEYGEEGVGGPDATGVYSGLLSLEEVPCMANVTGGMLIPGVMGTTAGRTLVAGGARVLWVSQGRSAA